MNKKANRRAFFVCIFVCLMYVSVAAKLPEKVSFKRIAHDQKKVPTGMTIYAGKNENRAVAEALPEKAPPKLPREPQRIAVVNQKDARRPAPDEAHMEPSFFMSIPVVCLAIKAKLLEKDSLISAGKSSYNIPSWKKPVDILDDRDEEGLRNISKTIDAKQVLFLLKKEGIALEPGLTAEEIILGRGYVVEKKTLLSFYNSAVPAEYDRLFPFVVDGAGIVRRNGSFEFIVAKNDAKRQAVREAPEWQMPNLLNLPMRVAVERLAAHTAKIRVMGSGVVSEQVPRPFERTTGEAECVIYGRVKR